MGLELLFQGAAAAASAGMGCGTCCSPGITAFLSGYLMTNTRNRRQSVLSFVSFYAGKIVAVTMLCMAASLAGTAVMDAKGRIGGMDIRLLVNIIMAGIALFFIFRWIAETNGSKKGCKDCHSCSGRRIGNKKRNYAALWTLGAGYGVTPCAPLILMMGYTATFPVWNAAFAGCIFALASSISPMLLLCVLSGFLKGPLQREIPQYLHWLRLLFYILLLVFSVLAML